MRIAAALIIAVCCYFVGCSFASAQKAACERLKGIVRLLAHMENRMRGSGERLTVILGGFCDSALEKCGFLDELRSNNKDCWERAARQAELPDDCISELALFGRSLGTVGLDEQLNTLESLKKLIEAKSDAESKGLAAKQKSTRAVFGLAGALAGLLLL